MNLEKILEDIGLSDKESKVYLALLELRDALPSVISRRANVKRPTTYVVLDSLQKRGLVSHVKRRGLLYFRALNPYSLLDDQHSRYSALEKALPELLHMHEKYVATPQMSVYEGRDGIIQIMEDTLKTKTELLCWADVPLAIETLLADYYPHYIETKVEREIWLRGILSYDRRALEFKKRGEAELREVYLIPKAKFPFKNEINIYDDKVAIVSHLDGVGVIIQNANIADTQRSIFNFGFEYAKILEEKILTPEDLAFLEG